MPDEEAAKEPPKRSTGPAPAIALAIHASVAPQARNTRSANAGPDCEDRKPKNVPGPRKKWWQNVTVWLVLGTWALAVVSFGQIWLTRSQFIRDQRPYLWMADDMYQGIDYKANPAVATVVIQNFGKTPALQVRVNIGLKPYPSNSNVAPTDRAENAFTDMLLNGPVDHSPMIPPAGRATYPVQVGPLTAPEISYLSTTDWAWVLVGRITYSDAYGSNYWMDFCIYDHPSKTRASGTYCQTHNEQN